MTVNSRLERVINTLFNGRKSAFASAIGVTPSVVDNIVGKRKGKPSFEVMEKISAIAELNIEWLITGRGNMLRDENEYTSPKSQNPIPLIDADERREHSITPYKTSDLKPRIPFSASAGALSIVANSIAFDQCEKFPVITMFPRYDFTMIIHGDSMEPDFISGDEVACQIVDDPRRIQWGRAHILDTMDGAVLKRIYKCDGGAICRSINKEYSDYVIPNEDILKVALVVGTLRRY